MLFSSMTFLYIIIFYLSYLIIDFYILSYLRYICYFTSIINSILCKEIILFKHIILSYVFQISLHLIKKIKLKSKIIVDYDHILKSVNINNGHIYNFYFWRLLYEIK